MNFKKRFLTIIAGISILACGIFNINNKPLEAHAADQNTSYAAWHVKAEYSWSNEPSNMPQNSNIIIYGEDNKEFCNLQIDQKNHSIEFNSLVAPSKFYLKFVKSKITKKFSWKLNVYYKNISNPIFSREGSKQFIFDKDSAEYIENIDINNIARRFNLESTGISNYGEIFHEFDIPNSCNELPNIYNEEYTIAGEATIRKFEKLPETSDQSLYFQGLESLSGTKYYDEQMLPATEYNGTDSTQLKAVFGAKIESKYNVTLYLNESMTEIYDDENYRVYFTDLGLVLPVIQNTNFIIYYGWFEVIDISKKIISETPSLNIPIGSVGDKYFVLKSHPAVYSVTLHTNGADSCKSLTSYNAGQVTTLPTPTRKGFNFVGWYDNANFDGNPIQNITNTVYGDVEFWAKWSGIEYTIYFVTYNQSSEVLPCTFIAGIGIDGTNMPVPVRDGYTFVGWFSTEFKTDVQPSINDRNYSSTGIGINNPDDYKNHTLYAKWNLTLSDNGAFRIICYGRIGTGALTDYDTTVTIKYGNSEITSIGPVNMKRDCTSVNNVYSMLLDTKTTFLPTEIIYTWNGHNLNRTTFSYTEIYYQDDLIKVIETNKYIVSDTNVKVSQKPSSSISHAEFTFYSEKISGDLSGYSFDVPTGSKMPILLGKNYLNKDGNIKSINYTKPTLFDSNSKELMLQGFYDLNANKKYFDENLNPIETSVATENVVLYPGFNQDLTYYSEGDKYQSSYLAGLNNPITYTPTSKGEDYAFVGWFLDEKGTGSPLTSIDANCVDPINLYARFDNYVYFDTDGGTEIDKILVKTGDKITKPSTNPTKTINDIRFIFCGWFADKTYSSEFDFGLPINEPTTVYAKFISYVDDFVLKYMHPEILPSDKGTGLCRTENWYSNAKTAFNNLNDSERDLFISEAQYSQYYERLCSWAIANNDFFDNNNLLSTNKEISTLSLINNEIDKTVVIICLVSVTSIVMFALYLRNKKRKSLM